ncbi:MAG: histidine triad nucleotide-binding protein [Chloroflexi bacterium]|nr:histidine triad nucleotide-binding protein [Chloroflexota bacterium]
MANECIFCKIVSGEIPSETLYQDELVTAFRDIRPVAPVHILVIPNAHSSSVTEMGVGDAGTLGRIVDVANQLAKQEGVSKSGFRLICNVGPDAGQVVYHTHFHLIGGRELGPMVAR